VRVRLKGVNSKRKQLADGSSFKTYYWAWKGAPHLRGEPGSPEFHASYNKAVAAKQPTVGKTLSSLTQGETVPKIPSDARQLASAIGHSGDNAGGWRTHVVLPVAARSRL
jgi:hypothetical protein